MGINTRNTRLLLSLLTLLTLGCTNNKDTDTLVVVHTKLGNMTVVLFDDTPKHKESFLAMARANVPDSTSFFYHLFRKYLLQESDQSMYDSTLFHRVIKGFMIQGGDVGTKSGFENEAKRLIPAELSIHHLHAKGALAAARQGDNINPERKSSTQFYIVQGRTYSEKELTTNLAKLNYAASIYLQSETNLPLRDSLLVMQEQGRLAEIQSILVNLKEEIAFYTAMNLDKTATPEQIELYTTVGGAPELDFEYTVFGQVVKGLEVIDKIANVQTGIADRPVDDIYIKTEVIELKKTEITEKYGYEYPVVGAEN